MAFGPARLVRSFRHQGGASAMLAALAVLLFSAVPLRAADELPVVVVDRQSGQVLVEQRPFDRWYPASLTKLMTVYVALRAMAAGEVSPGSPVIMSRNAANEPPSRMGFRPGAQMRLDNAIPVLVIKSANDVSVAVAESIAGTEAAFVERMNAEARRLGMTDSRFANPSGLHSPDNYSSARDMALLARRILIEFPQYSDLFAAPAIRYNDKLSHSYNLLLSRFAGADGLKTGFVCASGYNFAASATRNGRQLIAVVLGEFSQTDRAVAAAKALLTGFERSEGPVIDDFVRAGSPVEPKSQRGRMCSEKARQQRYDPGAGQAVIDSPLLEKGLPTPPAVTVALGGIDADPADGWLAANLLPPRGIPVPARRPTYPPEPIGNAKPSFGSVNQLLAADSVPVPTPRPER